MKTTHTVSANKYNIEAFAPVIFLTKFPKQLIVIMTLLMFY